MSNTITKTIGEIATFAAEAVAAYETGSDTIKLPNGIIQVQNTGGNPAKFSLLQALLAVSEYELTGIVDIHSGDTEITYIPNASLPAA